MSEFADCKLFVNDKYTSLRESMQEELDEMLDEIESMRKSTRTVDGFRKKLNQYVKETGMEKFTNEREKIRDIAKTTDNIKRVFDPSLGGPEEGLASLLRSTNYHGEGAARSVESVMNVMNKKYGNYIAQNLTPEQVKVVISKGLDQEILHVLAGGKNEVSDAAKQIAGVFRKLQDMVHADKKATGIEINYLKDRGINQRDLYNISKMQEIGEDAWVETTYSRLDLERTFPFLLEEVDRKQYLKDVYQGFIQRHFDKEAVDFNNIPKDLIKSSIQRKNLKPRALHYTAEGLGQMWEQFSDKTILDSLMAESAQASRDIALYDVLGSKGLGGFAAIKQKTIRKLAAEIQGTTDPAIKAKLQKQIDNINARSKGSNLSFEGDYDTLIAGLSGKTDQIGNEFMADAGDSIRALTSMRTLGGSMFSALTDTFAGVTALNMATGGSYFKAIGQELEGLFSTWRPSDQKELAEIFDLAIESEMGNELRIASSSNGITKAVNIANKWYSKLNPIAQQGRYHRVAPTMMLSWDFAKNTAGKSWDEIGDSYKKTLSKSGIKEADFEAFKLMRGKWKGKELIMPHAVSEIPDDVALAAIKQNKTENPNFFPSTPDEYRAQLSRNLGVMFGEEFGNFAAPQPGLREKAFLLGTSQKGTYGGEAIRMLAMLKSFTVKQASIMQKIYVNNPTAQGRAKQLSAHTIGLMTMGYVSLSLKALINNETPPDPSSPATMKKIAITSGAFGLLGDMMLDESNRGGVLKGFIGGPVVASVDELTKLSRKLVTGEAEMKDIGELLRFVPGNNLFYLKAGFNYTLNDDFRETISPGFNARMEQRRKENSGQLWEQTKVIE
jgi:hypothetical protein